MRTRFVAAKESFDYVQCSDDDIYPCETPNQLPTFKDFGIQPPIRKITYAGQFFAGQQVRRPRSPLCQCRRPTDDASPALTKRWVARQGESCDQVCRASGKSCEAHGFRFANSCDTIQRYFPCKMCWKSQGADQPAMVTMMSAPPDKHPGDCMIEVRAPHRRADHSASD